jgi:hypothetical protein
MIHHLAIQIVTNLIFLQHRVCIKIFEPAYHAMAAQESSFLHRLRNGKGEAPQYFRAILPHFKKTFRRKSQVAYALFSQSILQCC